MNPFVPPQQRAAWQALQTLADSANPHLRELLQDHKRTEQLQASGAGITIDYSHQRVTSEILQQLFALADESQVMAQAKSMFRGERINRTEHRAVLHVALRAPRDAVIEAVGCEVVGPAQAIRGLGIEASDTVVVSTPLLAVPPLSCTWKVKVL